MKDENWDLSCERMGFPLDTPTCDAVFNPGVDESGLVLCSQPRGHATAPQRPNSTHNRRSLSWTPDVGEPGPE